MNYISFLTYKYWIETKNWRVWRPYLRRYSNLLHIILSIILTYLEENIIHMKKSTHTCFLEKSSVTIASNVETGTQQVSMSELHVQLTEYNSFCL